MRYSASLRSTADCGLLTVLRGSVHGSSLNIFTISDLTKKSATETHSGSQKRSEVVRECLSMMWQWHWHITKPESSPKPALPSSNHCTQCRIQYTKTHITPESVEYHRHAAFNTKILKSHHSHSTPRRTQAGLMLSLIFQTFQCQLSSDTDRIKTLPCIMLTIQAWWDSPSRCCLGIALDSRSLHTLLHARAERLLYLLKSGFPYWVST